MSALPDAIRGMDRLGMRLSEVEAERGICTVVCKACGWRGTHASIKKLAAEPHPCARCHGGDWRSIGEIAAGIALGVRR